MYDQFTSLLPSSSVSYRDSDVMAERYPNRDYHGRGGRGRGRGRSSSRERRDRAKNSDLSNETRMNQQRTDGIQIRQPLLHVAGPRDDRNEVEGLDRYHFQSRTGPNHHVGGRGRRGRGGHSSGEQSYHKHGHSNSDGWKREKMDELSMKSPNDIVDHLYENQNKLKAYVGKWKVRHPKELANLTHVLDKTTKSDKLELSTIVLAIFFDADNSVSFWSHTMALVKKMPMEQSVEFSKKNKEVLKRLCNIFICVLERIPQTCALMLPVNDLAFTIRMVSKNDSNEYKNLKTQIEKLKEFHEQVTSDFMQSSCNDRQQPQTSSHAPRNAHLDLENEQPMPFGDFRRVVILPSVEELVRDQGLSLKNRQVRSNRVHGRYIDWNHYFDIHFRLLREDFVHPLREGLFLYLEGQIKRNTDVRVYTGVRVLEPVCLFSDIGFQVKFDVSRLRRVNWDHSKRLIFGSLLCLSSDNFKHIHFATVVQRSTDHLTKGIVTIKFEDNTDGFRLDTSTDFTMIESSAYFEAYRHVLKRLQVINTDLLPFKEYLVECKTDKVVPPLYLQTSRNRSFDLHDVLGISRTSITGRYVDVLDKHSWPASDVTCFDPSQLTAMQMALTQSVSVIQGPPGTGKTYVGVRIVEALLNNKEKWRKGVENPILVVCYTNHALDQFLEYINSLQSQPVIVRIGGRARSEEMKACSLRNFVQERKTARAIPHEIFKHMQSTRRELYSMKTLLEKKTLSVSNQEDKLLSLEELKPYIDYKYVYQLENHMLQWSERDAGKELEVWLELWFPTPVNPPELPDEDQLAREMESLNVDNVDARTIEDNENEEDEEEEEEEEEGVEVDEEARLAQDQRMMEGEELFLEDGLQPPEGKPKALPKVPVRKPGKFEWQIKQLSAKKKKKEITEGLSEAAMSPQRARQVRDIFALSKKEKWKLYQYWTQEFIRQRKSEAQLFAAHYQELGEQYTKLQQEVDLSVLNSADIIGMTTTGAAKHSYILENLVPKIVVIEEAAEVLESHIVSSLSSGTQQLILIGDHKQLRPKPTTFELVHHCHMDVSLFERLADNNYPRATLEIQHRMHPEIRKLVHPHIYERLLDHDTVMQYPPILGVGKRLFFISHNCPEDPNDDQDLLSHSNQFEVGYIVGLCHYLLRQGYKPEQITILTMYKGQLLKLKKKMPKSAFGGVRVAAVDDFQGEENDIILLSLVRSNSSGSIGFLKDNNRVCVALSRAKLGLYVIGNFEMLRTKDGTVWQDIISDVDKRHFLGQALPLYCCNHPETKTLIFSASDFARVPEGGCSKPCGVRLTCGHSCKRTCHVLDKEHKSTKCMRDCQKTLPCRHVCRRRCYECVQGCPPCSEIVERKLQCGHLLDVMCGESVLNIKCTRPCKNVLPCRHPCQNLCFEVCPVKCTAKVEKKLSCGHVRYLPCSVEPQDAKCLEPCNKLLECGHLCKGTCSGCVQGRLHQPCTEPCDRTLACGHICKFPCTKECPPCEEKCHNYCNHSRCPKKCKEPCPPCAEACQWVCHHHRCSKRCGEQCNRQRCNQPCTEKLKCKHRCIGLCGEECPKLCRVCDEAKVTEIFFGTEDEADARFIQLKDCNHFFEVRGLDRWMDQELVEDRSKARDIQFKQCPKCKTPIRRSLRYGNIIKRTLGDMERVKAAIFRGADANPVDLTVLVRDMRTLRRNLHANRHYLSIMSSKLEAVKQEMENGHSLSHHEKCAYQTKCSVIGTVGGLVEKIGTQKSTTVFVVNAAPLKCEELLEEMTGLLEYVCKQKYFSNQQADDIETELKRLSLLVSWCEIAHKDQLGQAGQLTSDERYQLVKLLQYFRLAGLGQKAPKLSADYYTRSKEALDSMKKRCGCQGISNDERIMIVKAMGLTQGHWFKCPNGHIYCITECGGATEEGVCPECKSRIGGTRHQLRSDNRVATEMDGARHPAFSEEANRVYLQELNLHFGN